MVPRAMCAVLALAVGSGVLDAAERRVWSEASFESGKVQAKESRVDGGLLRTLPHPQLKCEFVATSSGGAGPDSNWDTRVVSSEVVGGVTITPRAGKYFLRSALYYDKQYEEINGTACENLDLDKPRSAFAYSDPVHSIEWDKDVWLGFSIMLPKSWEHETMLKDARGSAMLVVVNSGASATEFALRPYVPSGATTTAWMMMVQVNAKSTNESDAATKLMEFNLGSVTPDLGQWTDFVIHFRINPFATTTNPATAGIPNALNRTFEGNRGILQVWKAEGAADASGNRQLVQKLDMVNTPVGIVPSTSQLEWSLRIYKHGWKKNPTTVKGPIWVGFDDVRWGMTDRDGTGFEDVLPGTAVAAAGPAPPSAPALLVE